MKTRYKISYAIVSKWLRFELFHGTGGAVTPLIFHLMGCPVSQLVSKDSCDEMQAHIYAGGDTCRGHDVAGVHIANVTLDHKLGVFSSQALQTGPVCCDFAIA